MTTDAADLTAHELLRAYGDGELSPVEATQACLDRIDALDERYNAFCLVDAEHALASAQAAEERWGQGQPRGTLDGVPVAIKDVYLTAGWPTRKGSTAISPDGPWDEDAPAVARLRETGAVFVGKTTTPELGWKGVTDSPLEGATGNPWDPTRTAGGSSGGTATAVVLGMAPLGTGTDGGGSIRIPAGFSGLVGIKPTFGQVPHYPPSPFGTLAHAGPMARTVPDLALMLDVMVRPDRRDWHAMPPPDVTYAESLDADPSRWRIAYSPTLGYVDLDPEVASAVDRAAERFAELGATVEPVDPGFDDPIGMFNVLWYAGAAKALESFDPDARTAMDPGLLEVGRLGAGYSASDYLEANGARDELGVHMSQFHGSYDLLLTPTLPIPAFAAGQEVPDGWPTDRWTDWTPFSYPFNLTQQPAISVPCGFTEAGLPIGLQLVGAKHADLLVLQAAHAYQQAHPLTDRRPTP